MCSLNGTGNIPILMYHSISISGNAKFKPFTVAPERFAQQMAYLYEHAYTPMTVSQLIQARTQATLLPPKPLVLTFDDGLADFYTAALPILQRYQFGATLYLATAYINETSRWLRHEGEGHRPMLTWDQVRDVQRAGIECGGHTHTHPQLDVLGRASAYEEITRCKQLLEEQLAQPVLSFAYPFGYYTRLTQQLVRDAGYQSACAVKHTMSTNTTDAFALTRLMVSAHMHLHDFAALLSGQKKRSLATLYARARTPLWQYARLSYSTLLKKGTVRAAIGEGKMW